MQEKWLKDQVSMLMAGQAQGKKPNRLIFEKSPYLLQHAYNPVDWYPWGQEAFEKAETEDKPIFLSIGYSTCHWCHVMEKESFEDDEVAGLMNETFVSIKVDREERPDLDSIYMNACQRMIGSGGWPLNILMTSDKKPFFAATYIPKESKFGRAGMLDMIPRIKDLWTLHRKEAEDMASHVVAVLKEATAQAGEGLNEDVLHAAYEQLLDMFDEQHGGFGIAPKFPTPHNLTFLLRYWKRTGDEMALWMVEKTLSAMHKGGIYDHVGFGFHRYSTDSKWLVPHFEKMLYDQALIAIAYIEAYQVTGKKEYEKTAHEIFAYVLRDMTAKEGGFFSAEDADSEGVEGKFYLWTEEETRSIISDNDDDLIKKVFNVYKSGNFTEMEDLQKRLEAARQKLYTIREKRIHPGKDDKIITDWNGLMITALAKGAQVFDESRYMEAAQKAADFILSKMRDSSGRLYHRYRDGEIAIPAFLDDYAFLIWGLIELYETTFDASYLKTALALNNVLLKHFWDEKNHGFYFTADDIEEVIIRRKEIYDGAVPSGNSVAMLNLLRLGRMTANPEFESKAEQIERAFSRSVLKVPSAHTQLMAALDFAAGSSEVVISGDLQRGDTKAMLKALRREFIPSKVIVFRQDGVEIPEIIGLADYTRNLSSMNGKATAFVCKNYSCKLPTTDTEKMLELLKASVA